jgi:hypothetical protein
VVCPYCDRRNYRQIHTTSAEGQYGEVAIVENVDQKEEEKEEEEEAEEEGRG